MRRLIFLSVLIAVIGFPPLAAGIQGPPPGMGGGGPKVAEPLAVAAAANLDGTGQRTSDGAGVGCDPSQYRTISVDLGGHLNGALKPGHLNRGALKRDRSNY